MGIRKSVKKQINREISLNFLGPFQNIWTVKAAEAVEVNGVDHETSSEAESEHAPEAENEHVHEAEPEAEQPAVDQDREMDVKKEDLLKVR